MAARYITALRHRRCPIRRAALLHELQLRRIGRPGGHHLDARRLAKGANIPSSGRRYRCRPGRDDTSPDPSGSGGLAHIRSASATAPARWRRRRAGENPRRVKSYANLASSFYIACLIVAAVVPVAFHPHSRPASAFHHMGERRAHETRAADPLGHGRRRCDRVATIGPSAVQQDPHDAAWKRASETRTIAGKPGAVAAFADQPGLTQSIAGPPRGAAATCRRRESAPRRAIPVKRLASPKAGDKGIARLQIEIARRSTCCRRPLCMTATRLKG